MATGQVAEQMSNVRRQSEFQLFWSPLCFVTIRYGTLGMGMWRWIVLVLGIDMDMGTWRAIRRVPVITAFFM